MNYSAVVVEMKISDSQLRKENRKFYTECRKDREQNNRLDA